jgi:hypothetical protein
MEMTPFNTLFPAVIAMVFFTNLAARSGSVALVRGVRVLILLALLAGIGFVASLFPDSTTPSDKAIFCGVLGGVVLVLFALSSSVMSAHAIIERAKGKDFWREMAFCVVMAVLCVYFSYAD